MRETDKILYIVISPDGLSFWTVKEEEVFLRFDKTAPTDENLRRGLASVLKKAGGNADRIRIYPDTAKTILIPNELFDAGMTQEYFAINGIAAANDRLLVSDMDFGGDKIKIITAVDRLWGDIIDEVFEGRAEFFSPFVINRHSYLKSQKKNPRAKDCTALYLTARNVYITVNASASGRMLYCEVLPYSSPADILYYMTDLATRFDILKGVVHIKGRECRETLRALRKTFKKAETV